MTASPVLSIKGQTFNELRRQRLGSLKMVTSVGTCVSERQGQDFFQVFVVNRFDTLAHSQDDLQRVDRVPTNTAFDRKLRHVILLIIPS